MYTATMIDCFEGDPRGNRGRVLAGDWYVAANPDGARRAQRAVPLADAVHRVAIHDEPPTRLILDELVAGLAEEAGAEPPLYVDDGEHITIGDRTSINYNLTVRGVAAITIGADCELRPMCNYVHLRARSTQCGSERSWRPPRRSPSGKRMDTRWCGRAARRHHFGDNSAIGAGSMVRRIPAEVMAADNPACVVREL